MVPPLKESLVPLVLTLFAALNQAFFMTIPFAVSAFFTAASCDRKGVVPLRRDLWLRLGTPVGGLVRAVESEHEVPSPALLRRDLPGLVCVPATERARRGWPRPAVVRPRAACLHGGVRRLAGGGSHPNDGPGQPASQSRPDRGFRRGCEHPHVRGPARLPRGPNAAGIPARSLPPLHRHVRARPPGLSGRLARGAPPGPGHRVVPHLARPDRGNAGRDGPDGCRDERVGRASPPDATAARSWEALPGRSGCMLFERRSCAWRSA